MKSCTGDWKQTLLELNLEISKTSTTDDLIINIRDLKNEKFTRQTKITNVEPQN